MKLKYKNFQVQDSVSNNPIKISIQEQGSNVNNKLNIERNTIEIPTIREFVIDSARLIKPKRIVRPVVKTIPQIPTTDSIEQPQYNVVDNNFLLPQKPSFFDKLHFTPYNPAQKIINHNKIVTDNKKSTKSISEIITITADQNFVTKSKLKTSSGFLSTDWMLGIIILSLIIFSWIRVGFSRYFQIAIQASYNYFTARRITEEVNVVRNRVFYFMNFLFYINITLFITQYLEYYHIAIFKLQGILLFFTIFISIILLYSAKSILFYFLDFMFIGKGSFTKYNFTVFLYNKIIGIALLPIISLLPYTPTIITPWLFYTGAFIIILLYILRIFRGLQISFKNRLSIFYLILYLCALEIMPILILFKVITNYL